jgi:nitroreductase
MDEQELLQLIKQRKTSRAPFDENRPIEPSALRRILEAAACAPTAHNMQNFEIVVVDDKAALAGLSELESSLSPTYVRENYSQVSMTEDELRRRKTGFLANQFSAEWLTPEARDGKLTPPPSKLGGQIRRGPVLLLALYDPARRAPASEGDFLGVMSLGFMLENMWLMTTAQGIGFQIISAMGNEPLASEIKALLGIPAHLRLVFGCRLGYLSKEDRYRLRVCRDVEDFVHHNKY